MTTKTPIPGDWFAFKLSNGQVAHGLVTHTHKSLYGLGYFFGPASDTAHNKVESLSLSPQSAALVGKFGFLGFKTADWFLLGRDPEWDQREWPIPRFVRHEELTGRTYLVQYGPDLGQAIGEELLAVGHTSVGPEDGLMGHGFVVARMSRLLGIPAAAGPGAGTL